MCLTILLLIFGILALAKGEFKITGSRRVSGEVSRFLGVVMILGAGVPIFVRDYGFGIAFLILIFAVVVGLVQSEKIEKVG